MKHERVATRTVSGHVRRDEVDTASLMRRPIDLAEVERIADIPDDRFRALRIALGHYDISRRFGDMLESRFGTREAIWPSFAVWSTLSVHRVLSQDSTLYRVDGRVLSPLLAKAAMRLFGGALATGDALHQLGEGNRDVFAEIASELLRVADEVERHDQPNRSLMNMWIKRRVRAHVRGPGFLEVDRQLLRDGVSFYYEALFEPDDNIRAAMILNGNLLLGEYEQRRLQWRIEQALSLVGESRDRRLQGADRKAINRMYARFITRHALAWESPLGGFRPWIGLPEPSLESRVPLPPVGTHEAVDHAYRLLAKWLDPAQWNEQPRVNDWTSLDQRMSFIAALFLQYQRERRFLVPPFQPRLTELIVSPDLVLDGPAERQVAARIDAQFPEPKRVDTRFPDAVLVFPDPEQRGPDYGEVIPPALNRLVLYYDRVDLIVPAGTSAKSREERVEMLGGYTVELVESGLVHLAERPDDFASRAGRFRRNFDEQHSYYQDRDEAKYVPVESTAFNTSRGPLNAVLEDKEAVRDTNGGPEIQQWAARFAYSASAYSYALELSRHGPDRDRQDQSGLAWAPLTIDDELFRLTRDVAEVRDGPYRAELVVPCPVMPAPEDQDAGLMVRLRQRLGERCTDHRWEIERHLFDYISASVRVQKMTASVRRAIETVLAETAGRDKLLEHVDDLDGRLSDVPRPRDLQLDGRWQDFIDQEADTEINRVMESEGRAVLAHSSSGRSRMSRKADGVERISKDARVDDWIRRATLATLHSVVSNVARLKKERKSLANGQTYIVRELKWSVTKLVEDLRLETDTIDQGAIMKMYLDELQGPEDADLARFRAAVLGISRWDPECAPERDQP